MSSSSDIVLKCDRTGFPFLEISNACVSLLPVTWWQMERRLSEPGGRSSQWYQSLFSDPAVNRKRGSWQTFQDAEREDIFVTGVMHDEAIDYVKWLKGTTEVNYAFDLPQADLWRGAAEWMQAKPFDAGSKKQLTNCGLCPAASTVIDRLITQIRPRTWFDLALFKHGLFEWVRDHKGVFGGLGAPRISRLRHTFNPFDKRADPVRAMGTGRPILFGLRPIVLSDELVQSSPVTP